MLQYRLVRGAADADLSTVENALTNGTVTMDWAVGVTTTDLSGFSEYETVQFAVVVMDGVGNKALYAPQSVTTTSSNNAPVAVFPTDVTVSGTGTAGVRLATGGCRELALPPTTSHLSSCLNRAQGF